MGLKHIVVTSVTRDDLQDGGAAHFASVITAVRSSLPGASIEVLVPDFNGDPGSLDIVMNACPDIFNHNIETVPRLYSRIRPGADYARSIRLLHEARLRLAGGKIKSGLMVGFGEREEEVLEVMKDCLGAGCSILTIGQYLQPSGNQVPVEEFITPGQFKKYELKGLALGFEYVFSGPYIRSSYRASECAKTLNRNVIKR